MPASLKSSGIRDNHYCGSVGEFLKSHIQNGSRLSVVSAYFTIYAYEALKDRLDRIAHMDFLFGEPSFVKSLDPNKTESKAFIIAQDGLKLANVLRQKRIARECADWIRRKVDIKSVCRSNFLHGKLYHVRNDGEEVAVIGSSNFTPRGLGLQNAGSNIELNLIVRHQDDREELNAWFDRLWADPELVADVKDEVLLYLAQVYRNQTPEFIYYKTLYQIFEKFLGDARRSDEDLGRTTLFDSDIWKALFDFQKDGVKGIINKILAHNGCILADSVGLGKTYEALAVIKFFELRNERVLVLCPKKLRDNWTVYRLNDQLNPFGADRFRYDVLSHTDLSRESGYSGDINLETLNWSNYDLVVIDESHNFRNNTPGRRDEQGNLIRRSRYQRLMEDIIQSGVRTKVLLVSATPVNNDLKDLRNQIYFITAGGDEIFREAIGIRSLKETLRQAQTHFSNWAKQQPAKRKTFELLLRLGSDFFKLLDELTIARARKHVQKYYGHEMERLGGFPKRLKPLSLYPEIDTKRRFLSYDKLNEEIGGYKLWLFNPSKYVKEEFRPLYQKAARDPFTQADRETFLIGMMKVNFLKRLESSVKSFEITMDRTVAKIVSLEEKILQFQAARHRAEEFAGDELALGMDDDEELRDAFEVGTKFKYNLEHMHLDEWLKDLKKDKDQLTILHLSAKDVTPERDAKLAELKALIAGKAERPSRNKMGKLNRKVLVFTAFADTAEYLYENLNDWALKDLGIHTALVVGTGQNRTTFRPAGLERPTDYNRILTNFSPISKGRGKIPSMPQEGEIDLLIATDCISEGQNLQDCDYLINYDIHWNPVRIIQRFGRVDRIGSVNPAVQLVNFWPTPHLDRYISLKHRVEARMALVDIAATLEENLLKAEDLEDLIKDDLRYRDRQLLRLKDEVLDLEDLEDTVSLTEFTLDDFRIDLLKYLEANRMNTLREIENRIQDIERSFDTRFHARDYARKLYLIENCIYGVDIQPNACQIAKLRFFIALIVDQNVDRTQKNFGVRPLPNLETKIVSADTLIPIEKPRQHQVTLADYHIRELREKLERVRHDHFNARTPQRKERCRQRDAELRAEIAQVLEKNEWPQQTSRALAAWDPYDQNHSAGFFDPEWMFGVPVGKVKLSEGARATFRGILTGLNEAFVVDRATRDRLIAEHQSLAEILKPFLRGRDVKRWRVEFGDQYLIRIESSENKRHPWSGKKAREAEKIFAKTYPAIHRRFEDFRHALILRDDQGHFFWELRSCAYWHEFERPKIIYPNICKRNEFAWDGEKYYANQKAFIIPEASKYLLGILNSSVVMWLFRRLLAKLQNDFYEPSSVFMKDFPIPFAGDPTVVERPVDSILGAIREDAITDVSKWEREIDERVYRLYGLTKDEIAIVEGTQES